MSLPANERLDIYPTIPDDRPRILEITHTSGLFSNEEIRCVTELIDDYFQKAAMSPYMFLSCRARANPIGYICFGHRDMTNGTFDAYWMAIDAKYRRIGVGKRLMLATESHVIEMGGHLLTTETSDNDIYSPTRTFLQSIGFDEVARIANFYKPNEGIVMYAKYLGDGYAIKKTGILPRQPK
jgi:ribosomal protein S18 acetylase RimI-like enzyme